MNNTENGPIDRVFLKAGVGFMRKKIIANLALSYSYSSCEDLQELIRLISNMIG